MTLASLSRRTWLAAIAATAVMLCTAAAALAAHPAKNKTYSGTIKQKETAKITNRFAISFKVSRNGKHVSRFKLPQGFPLYCHSGGVGGLGSPKSKSAKVSSKGTFKVSLPVVFAPTRQKQGTLKISGKFKKHRKESGKVKTALTGGLASCDGSIRYSAKVPKKKTKG